MDTPDESQDNVPQDGAPEFLDASQDGYQEADPEFSPEVEAAVWEWLVVDGGNMTLEERIDQAASLGRYDIVDALERLGDE